MSTTYIGKKKGRIRTSPPHLNRIKQETAINWGGKYLCAPPEQAIHDRERYTRVLVQETPSETPTIEMRVSKCYFKKTGQTKGVTPKNDQNVPEAPS